jgi:cell division septation protein DedD
VLVALLLGAVVGFPPRSTVLSASSTWTGGVDLYRSGVFTTQKSWLWCTAASVQIIGNIVRGEVDHSRASQSRYFDYMRAHDRYRIPVTDGTDPGGWTAGLRKFVDDRYRLVASDSFDAAVRSAVTNLRKTELPVGLAVAHGDHAWVLTGFTATADPATTTEFTVTSVRVVGPLFGLRSRRYGYDMPPDTRLTLRRFDDFFTPWHYGSVHMAWENKWVSIQPIAAAPDEAAASPDPTAPPVASPTRAPVAPATAPATAPAVAEAKPSLQPAVAVAGAAVASTGAPFVVVLFVALVLAVSVFALGIRSGPRPSR